MDVDEGALIGAGIVWAWKKDKKYGLVAEVHDYMNRKTLNQVLEWKIREIEIDKINYQMEVSKRPWTPTPRGSASPSFQNWEKMNLEPEKT
jgi:pyruvoyl-dependent arginine decarboxylase (PvlArgDC)